MFWVGERLRQAGRTGSSPWAGIGKDRLPPSASSMTRLVHVCSYQRHKTFSINFTMQSWLAWSSLCRPGCLRLRDLPASFWVLQLKVCGTMSAFQ